MRVKTLKKVNVMKRWKRNENLIISKKDFLQIVLLTNKECSSKVFSIFLFHNSLIDSCANNVVNNQLHSNYVTI